jgi:exosome complex RNA-binding protein Csl4
MRVLNDYYCPTCKTVTEHLEHTHIPVVCSECGDEKVRKMAAPMTNGNCAHGMVFRSKH